MALAPLRPAPDLVSLVAFGLSLAGALLLATGQGLAAGLLVHASSVADGVDGEVARLQFRSGRGALLDGLLDRVADAAILAGVGLWALDGHSSMDVLVLTVSATTGALLSMASRDRAAACARAGAWVAARWAGTGGCCWLPWARSWAHRSRSWSRSRPPRRCRSACGSPSSADRRSPNDQTQPPGIGVSRLGWGWLRGGA